jgi:hypothetical protein
MLSLAPRRVALVALALAVLLPSRALASHSDFMYKWPWLSGASAVATTLPYDDVHDCSTGNECVDAYDLVIWRTGLSPLGKGSCPVGAPGDCTAYQQFECGYIYTPGTSSPVARPITGALYNVSDDLSVADHYRQMLPCSGWTSKGDTPPNNARTLRNFGDGLLVHGVDATGTVRVSQDSGETWSNATSPDSSLKPVDIARAGSGRLWSLWQNSSSIRVYYSDNLGSSWTLSNSFSLSFAMAGSIAVSPDGSSIAIAYVLNTTALRVAVSTNGGSTWATYTPGGNGGISPQITWSGGNLVLAADNGTTLRMLLSTNGGLTWNQQQTFTTTSFSTKDIQIVPGPSVLFAVVASSDTSPQHVIARCGDNGASWTAAAAVPSGTTLAPRGAAYDSDSDILYVTWTSKRVTRLRFASTRDFGAITSADWEDLPSLSETPATRGLVVIPDAD